MKNGKLTGLSESEIVIFNMLSKHKEVTLDDINKTIDDTSRQALIVRLKYLGAKVAPQGYIIERVSKLGRGAKAKYRMKKMF